MIHSNSLNHVTLSESSLINEEEWELVGPAKKLTLEPYTAINNFQA